MSRHAAFDAGRQQVLQTNVGEGAAHHHFVIARRRAPYWLKSFGSTPYSIKYFAASEVLAMLLAGEMILGDEVAEHELRAGVPAQIDERSRPQADAVEEGSGAARRCSTRPTRIGHLPESAARATCRRRGTRRRIARRGLLVTWVATSARDDAGRGPHVRAGTRLSVAVRTQRLGVEADVDAPREGEYGIMAGLGSSWLPRPGLGRALEGGRFR